MKKLQKKSQMILYAVSGMGVNMLNLMMGSYLCSALLIGGFAKADIPFQTFAQRDLVIAAVWSILVFLAKLIDGVIDIPLASFADQLKTRWGRRRPAIAIGLFIMVAAYVLFLVVPNPNGATLMNTIYYGILLCIFYSFYTLTMVTYYATFTEIVETDRERELIANTKSVCDILYFVLGYVIVRMLLNGMNIRPVALLVLPLVLTMLIPMFMIKENADSVGATAESKSVKLLASLKHTCRNKPFMKWMIVYFLMTFGVQLFLGGINEYFSFVGLNMMVVMGLSFSPVPFALIFYNRLLRKRGFGFAFRYVLLSFSVGMICMYFVGRMPAGTMKLVGSIVCGLICSLAIGALFSVAYSIPSQLAAEEERRTGVSNAAMYFAVQGLFSGVGTGLATGIVLTALKGTEGSGSTAIIFMTLISGLGTLVAFLATYLLPKTLLKNGRTE